jgi:hypothetical protein
MKTEILELIPDIHTPDTRILLRIKPTIASFFLRILVFSGRPARIMTRQTMSTGRQK